MGKVVILGNDHTNTLGLAQSLGLAGFEVFAAVWGLETGIVRFSKFVKKVIIGHSPDECICRIADFFANCDEKIPILCSCDSAALAVEKYADTLIGKFVFEYAQGDKSISRLQEKNLQVELAEEVGFHTPKSFEVENVDDIDNKLTFESPYIYKALKSVEGDKSDLTVCRSREELKTKINKTLKKTPRVLVQQYIERDYEISILGCGLTNGECIIPALENKLTLFPKNVGLECLAQIVPLRDEKIINPIKALINVGLFSVEMMHSKSEDIFYFTEINLRNDGAQSFIRKYGVNLPEIHVADLLGQQFSIGNKNKEGYYIWEIHHLYSLLYRDLSFCQWVKELCKARGGLVFDIKDPLPFFRQLAYPLLTKLKIVKVRNY